MRNDNMPVPANNMNSNDPALLRLLGSLTELGDGFCGRQDDLMFLQNVLASPEFHALFNAHNAVKIYGENQCNPVTLNSTAAMTALCNDMLNFAMIPEVRELCFLLMKPHMRALFDSHDKLANGEYIPQLPEVPGPPDTEYQEDSSVKVVRLVKGNEPLGATIKWDDVLNSVVIARVMHGGAADRSGLIHVGDVVHEVNGVDVRGRDPDEVVSLLSSSDGTITFKLVPAEVETRNAMESQKVRVKTYFDYNPYNDNAIPCPEAGLSFKKGDILHIVNQDDPMWWQARREGVKGPRAGLIPSKLLQERRQALNKCPTMPLGNHSTELAFQRSSLRIPTRSGGLRGSKRKIKKIMYQAKKSDEFAQHEIMTYEEVIPYLATEHPRPIVLVGPPGVGRNELKRRMMATNPDRYQPAIPHTSRPKKWAEEDGKEYYFIERSLMEEAIRGNCFLEYGEYKGNLYGTSIETIKRISKAGKVCIVNVHPQALKMLRESDLKPYVIYVKPPALDVLRQTRQVQKTKLGHDKNANRLFTEEEMVDMIHVGMRMESLYKNYFDAVVVNDHLTQSYNELMDIARKLEVEPQWIPSAWMR
ncbi:MAGUK p55 subfamily member 7-like isoform X2 [Acanthaster planci]|uniref:MAGUK p55 subfamily member 7-like isoform X2 n=1 Tax=Acanthaster planci TaxID=133434 RepID=A0A8B7YZD4_ACAPL|nr:MAGUK p55 subfamily member 7-like isoform X2 [Acanthaster planci]